MFRPAFPIVLFCGLLALASPGVGADDVDERLRALASSLGQKEAILRIGLVPAHEVTVRSSRAYRVVNPLTGEALWKEAFDGELRVVAHGGPADGVDPVYRIQVGAFKTAEAADAERLRLERLVGSTGVVRADPDRGNWRVRIGRADDRLSLGPLMDRLRQEGVQGLWIAEEAAEAIGDISLRLVDISYDSFPTGLDRVALVPTKGGRISVDGKPYRGLIELRVSPFGTVRPINWIELETYLRGVVPAELGPEVWPQLQALQAQAVAARTYVWRNRGQFADEGFDLCATPRCQVYEGAAAEHPLSDRAIAATKGEILEHEGTPIVALYTATCGGHTEDGREIFPEHDEPYLRGVPCRAGAEALVTLRGKLRGKRVDPVIDETGQDVTRDWSLLAVADVLVAQDAEEASAGRPVDGKRLRGWTRGLARLSRLPEPSEAYGKVETLAEVAEALIDDVGWTARAEVLLSSDDLPALLRGPETEKLDLSERRALAYLALIEAIRPFPDGGLHPERPATAARLAPALVRIGEVYEAFDLKRAVIAGMGAKDIRLVRGKGSVRLPLSRELRLFGREGGRVVSVAELDVWPGDRIRYRTGSGGAIDFLELVPPIKGTSDDRSAKLYSWETRKSRRVLERTINRRISIGRLKELNVLRRGVSGRVVELEVVGTKGRTVVRGFDVRRLLDLKESLLVIEPQRGRSGEIEAVVFAGKGWGHGVGLCQVGAYGMALRGADYREILAHYYTGTSLEHLQPDAP